MDPTKKYRFIYKCYYNINMIKILLVVVFFTNFLIAGAPPVDDKPLPPPPYTINKIKQLTISLNWEKESVEGLLEKDFQYNDELSGGITILNSKEKQDFAPFSGAFLWIDGKEDKDGIHIFFSTYGPNKLINRIMNRIYNINTSMGSNKVTMMNNNASARTNIRKKNVVSLSAKMTDDCVSRKGNIKIMNTSNKSISIKNYFSWQSKKVCNANINSINLSGELKKYKIKKVRWAKTYEDMTMVFTNPLKIAKTN